MDASHGTTRKAEVRKAVQQAGSSPTVNGPQPDPVGKQIALREMGTPSPVVALDYLDLLAEVKPEKLEPAAVRWHGRLELEAPTLTLTESQFALAALAMLGDGQHDAVALLRSLLRKVRPTLVPRMG